MKSKILLGFLLVAVNSCVFGMVDHYSELVNSGLNLNKQIHEGSQFGVVNQTVSDSQLPDDLKRGYSLHHGYEEFVWSGKRLTKITNSYKINQKNTGFKQLLSPVTPRHNKSVLLRVAIQPSSRSSCNEGSELDSTSSFETVE